jgi:hypothetical protein
VFTFTYISVGISVEKTHFGIDFRSLVWFLIFVWRRVNTRATWDVDALIQRGVVKNVRGHVGDFCTL